MRIKLLMIGLLSSISAATFAQKRELYNAQTEYEKYEVLKEQKVNIVVMTTADSCLNDAKTSIDKAASFQKTATLPLTYALKGAIYADLAIRDTVSATSELLFVTAQEAIKKAKESDTKGENKMLITNAELYLTQYKVNKQGK